MNVQIAELLEICRRRGITELTLDELVHEAANQGVLGRVNAEVNDAKQEALLDQASRTASDTNNRGMEAQLEHLLQQWTLDATRKTIEDVEVEE